MQCRICGSSISETDTVCKVCGAVQEEKKPVHNEEFQWTVHDFSRPKRTVEEVKMEWPKEPERPARSVDLDEPISFDIDIFKKRSAGEKLPGEEGQLTAATAAMPAGKNDGASRSEAQTLSSPTGMDNAQGWKETAPGAESPEGSAAAEARKESLRKADPFFDFSKTNIEFQDLLDQEYMKLQKRKEGVPYVETQWRYQPEEPEAPELPEHPEDALERMIRENTRILDPGSESTIQVDLSAIKRAAAKYYGYETDAAQGASINSEATTANAAADGTSPARKETVGAQAFASGTAAGMAAEEAAGVAAMTAKEVSGAEQMTAERNMDKPAEGIAAEADKPAAEPRTAEEVCPPESKPETQEQKFKKRRTMTEMERAREEYFRMLDQEMGGVQVQVKVNTPYGQTGKVVTDVDIQTGQSAKRQENYAPVYEEPEDILTGRTAETEAPKPPFVRLPGEQTGETAAGHENTPDRENTPVSEGAEEPLTNQSVAGPSEEAPWPLDPEEAEETQKGGFFSVLGKILLVLIAIAIALELTALGILYFAPASAAADAVYSVQEKVTEFIASVKEGRGSAGDDQDHEEDGDLQEDGEEPQPPEDQDGAGEAAIDRTPMADKTALIATQTGRNQNIKSITANSDLAYKSGVDYGNDDLNASRPIEDNLWYTDENGAPVYYDREIVGTLISFNSQWVDYVNNGDKAVLSLTKEGSRAYKNAVGFSKVGKVTEEFSSLEIGEIRQGAQGFYLWVQEKIRLTENGASSTANYQWVYCLEAADKQMKIVDYINVKDK